MMRPVVHRCFCVGLALLFLSFSTVGAQHPARPNPPAPPKPVVLAEWQIQQLWLQQQWQARALWQLQGQLIVPQPAMPRPQNARVLFIGSNDVTSPQLVAMLSALAESAKGLPLVCEFEVADNASLAQHLMQGLAVQKIQQGKWDVVVLQENKIVCALAPEASLQAALLLNQEIAKANARTLYFHPWPQKMVLQNPDQTGPLYQTCVQKSTNAGLAPVARAFQLARAADPNLALVQAGTGRPTPAGMYLTACVFYTSIYGKTPVGLSVQLKQGEKVLVDLPAATAKTLQQAALKAALGQ